MKKTKYYLVILSSILVACQMQEAEVGVPAPEITARVEAEPETRTVLAVDEVGAGTISWMPVDRINVFFGKTGTLYTSQNTANAASAVFRTSDLIGLSELSSTNIWGLYPYNSSATCTGSAVSTTLPAVQAGVPESFDDDLFITLAHSSTTNLQFYNVCSGIKFSLSRDDIKSVSFEGNNNEDLAGDISLTFEDSRPKATVLNGVKEITLTPKSGETFEKGVNYYIVTLPATLSKGFTITFTTTDNSVGTLNFTDEAVSLRRAIFSRKTSLDTYASFQGDSKPNNVIYYTSSNGIIVTPTRKDVFGAGIISNEYADGTGVICFDGDVKRIGPNAFQGCASLTSIVLPDSVKSIGYRAFDNCVNLMSVVIPKYVSTIESFAFRFCSKLKCIEIPDSVSNIGTNPFSACEELDSIVVESNNSKYDSRNSCNAIVETVSNTLISGCKVTNIPDTVTRLGDYSFFGCSGLTSIIIPNSVTSIGPHAFAYCSGLTSFDIPESVAGIEEYAFEECPSVARITINAAIPPILGQSVFRNTNDCRFCVPAGSIDEYREADGWNVFPKRLFPIPDQPTNVIIYYETEGKIVNPYRKDVFGADIISNEYVDGRGVITFNGDVTSIGDHAFYNCTGLSSIEIPCFVTEIGNYAFYNCKSLTSINIHPAIANIGDSAFSGCEGLTSIEIPASVESIRNNPFTGCSGLSSIVVKPSNKAYDSRNNCNAIVANSTSVLIVGCKNTIIPDSVVGIGTSAFYGCTDLLSIEIPSSVTSIGNAAFSGCDGLTRIEIPGSVESIGNNPFMACSGLSSIIVDSSNKRYDSRDNCNAIIDKYNKSLLSGCKSTIIPNSVTSISSDAFYHCTDLSSIDIPDSVKSIGYMAFGYCTSLTSIVLPDSITSVEQSTFYNCSSLTSAVLSKNIKTIGAMAFDNCTSLTTIVIPSSIESIGGSAFLSCTGLKSVTVLATTPPVADLDIFDRSSTFPIYVPSTSVHLYRGANHWSIYGYRIQAIPSDY